MFSIKKYEDFGGTLELPKVIEIEPFGSCNLRCRMCHVSYAPPGPKPTIKFEAVERLKSLAGKYVVFGSNFEPTAHPRFADMISLFVDYNFKMDLVTNGTLLTDPIIETMARGDFNKITFSFDGMRKETYEEIRRNSNYEETLENITKLRKAFWEKDTSFAINYVLMRMNVDEIIEAIDFWEELRFDMLGLVFMVIRDDNEYLRNQSLHPILEEVHRKLDEAAEYLIHSEKRICISSPPFVTTELKKKYPNNFPLNNVVQSMHTGKKNFPKLVKNGFQTGKYPGMPFQGCKSAFTFARILPSGQVRLCDQINIGDINTHDFEDIWYGAEATRFRKKLLSSAATCKSCNYYLLCLNQQNLNTKDPKTHLSKALREKAAKDLAASGVPEKLFSKAPAKYSPWLQKLVDGITFNCEESREEIEAVLKNCPSNEPAVVRGLAEYQIKKIQKNIKTGQKTLAVFYPSNVDRENLGSGEMYDRIRAQGYNVIFLFGVIRGDEFEKREYSYYAGHDMVNYFDFVDVFIFPTLMSSLPFASKKVLFVHDIYDSPKGVVKAAAPPPPNDGKPKRVPPLLDELDYSFLPCRALMPSSNKMHLIRQKPICRIPGGYIKLDWNIQHFKSIKVAIDSIIFAPAVHRDHFYDYVAVPEHGCDIVEALLKQFPDYKIIFRPHPHTIDTPEVQKVAEKFKDHPQFEFDTNASFYMRNYARSQLMVTDMSGTAFTYAFTTSRPVVFFSHKDETVEQVFGKIRYFKDREKIGYVAKSVQELCEKVTYILAHKAELEEKIGKFRDESIYNVGRTEDYIVENFRCIAEGEPHPDWQYVECPIIPRGATAGIRG